MAKFFRRGKSAIYFLPAVAGASPTRPEITAGTNLSTQITGIDGFQLSNERIDTPVLSSAYTFQIDGPDSASGSSLTFLDDDNATTARTTCAKGTVGFLILMPYGDVPTKRLEKWPIKSTGANDEWSMGNDPARFMIDFAVTDIPSQSGTVPA